MDKKEPTVVTEPMGMCEKLFHALQTNTAFRPIRRLTFGRQDQMDATAAAIDKVDNPPPPPSSFNDSLSSGKVNSLTPTKPYKTDIPKTNNQLPPAKQVTTTIVDKLTPPKKANMVKVENKVKKESTEENKVSPITKAPPSAAPPSVTIVTSTKTTKIEPKDSKMIIPLPTPAPPKGSISPQPIPPPMTTENPKKNINEKVEDYIQRAKGKFRTGSGVGKASSYNN